MKLTKKCFFKIIILIGLIFGIRIIFFNIISSDYDVFLKNWYNEIIQHGKFQSLGLQIGNYSPPYILLLTIGTYITSNSLLSVKVISLIFDIVMAVYACLIVKHFNINKYIKVFTYVMVLPGVILNSAVLGQCDSIYTAFVVMFAYYILKDKNKLAMLFFGVALSFKLQAIFIAPVMLYLLVTKKVKLFDIIYIILGFLILMLPAMLHGKSLIEILMVYIKQTKQYPEIVRSAPNIYSFLVLNYAPINLMIKYLISILAILTSVFISLKSIKKYNYKFDSNLFIIKVTLISLIVPYLLPGMMDRYFYMTNIFILINIFINKDFTKKDVKILILASIAYFIPVFSINFLLFNNYMVIISQIIGISLISSGINTYIVYKYFVRYVLNDIKTIHNNEIITKHKNKEINEICM